MSWDRLGRGKNKGGLGFRGFSEFNKALLGKQCWRLVLNENSLLARVLKSRYFPRSKLLSGPNWIPTIPSYAWRSLINARSVLEHGMRWHIGDGKKVRI